MTGVQTCALPISGYFGSRSMLGQMTAEECKNFADRDDITVYDAMKSYRLTPEKLPEAAWKPGSIGHFIELHIEQGPVLVSQNVDIGLVDCIVGIKRFMVSVFGQANHAGTTPMNMRHDPMEMASRVISKIGDTARAAGGGTVATVGFVKAEPGGMNVIANRVDFTLDIRAVDPQVLASVVGQIEQMLREETARCGGSYHMEPKLDVAPLQMSGELLARFEASCRAHGYSLTQVAEGDLRAEPQVGYQGDFVLIRSSLHTIAQSMNETLLGFRSAADRLTAMAEQLSQQSVQLHQASLEQNQSTEELVHEVDRVKDRLADVTESSGQTRRQTGEITQRIQNANEQMNALSSAMDDISVNAQQITKIAKDIEDIAFQTNILALNASVEAARAGVAGKGFAVVADEVKQLAAKSAEAAQSATAMMDNTKEIIQTGVTLTADTADSLRAISEVSAQINAISDHLAAAVQGQESALALMEARITAISDIADRNLQNAGETERSSGSLAKEAEALQTQVRKFVLKEADGR